MKSDPTFWLLARSSGLVAYALLAASVVLGLVVKSRPLGSSVSPAAVVDVHRFLALLGLGALALHGAALVADDAVDIGLGALLVPGVSPYRPVATTLGVLAAELMVVIYLSFSVRRRIGAKAWRALHWLTYLVFALATLHGLAAGTDSGRTWALAFYGAAVGAVLGALAWRLVVPPTQGGPRHVPNRDRQVAL
ncbi:MAG TPA: ferric reductase-like transmembrane domain-containing protein [Gaiellaceae bacterium]|nr:ferric reductase-like transmembrane domain-containing protein [Gaiellaceae bacterium]